MSDLEVVDRPERQRQLVNGEIAAILETAVTGRAVRLSRNGRAVHTWRGNIYTRLFRTRQANGQDMRGRVHTQTDGPDHLIVWVDAEKS